MFHVKHRRTDGITLKDYLPFFNIRKHTEQITLSSIAYPLSPLGILNPHLEHSWSLYIVTVLTIDIVFTN